MEKLQSLKTVFIKIRNSKSSRQAFNCGCCNKDFGLTRRKHLCKRCNRIICSSCGKNKSMVTSFDLKKPHRVCNFCEKDSHFQFTMRNLNQTSWAQQSGIDSKWRKFIAQNGDSSIHAGVSYTELLELANNSQNEYQDFVVIDRDVMTGRSNKETFNYSVQEFLYYNQQKFSKIEIQNQIRNVLRAFCIRYPSIGYCQGMNYITVFLLCFMNEESAFTTLSHVVLKILPKNFYSKTKHGGSLMGFQQEKFIICRLAQEKLNLNEKEAVKLDTFLDIYGAPLLILLLIDHLNFQVIYSTWKQMLSTESMDIIRKVMLQIIYMFLDNIKDGSLEKTAGFRKLLLDTFSIDSFNQAQEIEINHVKVAYLEEEFKKYFSSQWVENKRSVHYTLQKSTHFSKEEIQLLQEQFKKFLAQNKPNVESDNSENNLNMKVQEGINKSQFREILIDLASEDDRKQEYFDSLDFEQVFDAFDFDNSGLLDFKEFLFSLSMLMRGKLEEKVQFGFEVFDKEEKGYLLLNEYAKFVHSIVQASKIGNKGKFDPTFHERLEEFTEKLLSLAEGKDKVNFAEIHKALLSDKFVEYCNHSEVIRKRGTTVARIKKSFDMKFGTADEEKKEEFTLNEEEDNKSL